MAQFQYTAVNASGKKLSGIIGANTEDDARKQLNTFGISLLSIDQMGETPVATVTHEPGTSSELPKFEFEAYDKAGRKVLGTIPATSGYKAFKRLMEEYQFEVSYVVPAGASEEDRLKAKQEGLAVLKAEYEAQQKQKDAAEAQSEKMSAEFEVKRQELLKKVDFILSKIKELVNTFASDLKPEALKLIQGYVDKLLRIKSSTNLDYIEHTSEELLKKVQDQELFLTKEKMGAERDKLKWEAQKMMAELHSKPAELGLSENIEHLHSQWTGSKNPFIQSLGTFLERFVPSAEEKDLQQRIKTIRNQMWTYQKIVWTAPASTKEDARASLFSLKEEKKRLEQELRSLVRKRKQEASNEADTPEPLITEEVNGFLAWLLTFYLAAYFISYYASAKTLPGGNPLPGDFNLLDSELLRNLLLSVFIWHVLLSLKLEHLRYTQWATALTLAVGVLLNAALVYNL
ncbi:hypothetical protein IPG41_01535 [Candidatus Peregrinibacteria bacterium]|nr:MAG: hypothetical protein IPG41_01535 [Candidatus Peregrinibacteria bacterium]